MMMSNDHTAPELSGEAFDACVRFLQRLIRTQSMPGEEGELAGLVAAEVMQPDGAGMAGQQRPHRLEHCFLVGVEREVHGQFLGRRRWRRDTRLSCTS